MQAQEAKVVTAPGALSCSTGCCHIQLADLLLISYLSYICHDLVASSRLHLEHIRKHRCLKASNARETGCTRSANEKWSLNLAGF